MNKKYMWQVDMYSWSILSPYLHYMFNRFQYWEYPFLKRTIMLFIHRMTDLGWEGSPEHLVQNSCSGMVSYSRLLRIMSNQVLSISADGELFNFSRQNSWRTVSCSFLHPPIQLLSTKSSWLYCYILLPHHVPIPHPHQDLLQKIPDSITVRLKCKVFATLH